MPLKPVTVRRWEVVGAFLLLVAVAVFGDIRGDRRIDAAEKRITQNAVQNAAQNEVRRQLVAGFRDADARTCSQIEALKAEFRKQAVENFANLERNARLLEIELTPELRREAAAGRDRTLVRFAAREC